MEDKLGNRDSWVAAAAKAITCRIFFGEKASESSEKTTSFAATGPSSQV